VQVEEFQVEEFKGFEEFELLQGWVGQILRVQVHVHRCRGH
jgi:hypothetical protein